MEHSLPIDAAPRAPPERTRALVESATAPLLVFLLAFGVYLRTLAPTISWRNGGIDSGELVTAIVTLGIPHPTGFPVYVLLGKLFTLLPVGDPAYRVNVLSALFAAATAAVLVIAVRQIAKAGQNPSDAAASPLVLNIAAAGGALDFAFSPLFWSRATIAKEYSLHLFLMGLALTLILGWRVSRRPVSLVAFGLVLGIGLGVHVTILAIAPGVLAFVALVDRSGFGWRRAAGVAVALIPGLGTYLYLPLRAARHPYLNWSDPETPAGFIAHVTGSAYHDMLSTGLQPVDIGERVLYAIRIIPDQLGWPGFLALLVGIWAIGNDDRALLVLLGPLTVLSLAFATMYPVRDSEAYLLPVYLVGSLFVGVGLDWSASAFDWGRAKGWLASIHGDAAVAAGLVLVIVGGSLGRSYVAVDVSSDYAALDYARSVLSAAPANAIILADRDDVTFSLWYVQQVGGVRLDTVIVESRLLDWPWYRASLSERYPDLGLTDSAAEDRIRLRRGTIPGRPVIVAPPPA